MCAETASIAQMERSAIRDKDIDDHPGFRFTSSGLLAVLAKIASSSAILHYIIAHMRSIVTSFP
jgi:hypothetical protein